jgi:soluble P-type ATPase
VPITLEVPGSESLELHHAVFDVNGTLADRGELLQGVAPLMSRLTAKVDVHLLSADTFGTVSAIASGLDVEAHIVHDGGAKLRMVEDLGAARCVAVGNGRNDVAMFEAAALSLAVVGPEGGHVRALAAADLVGRSVVEAIELLLDERALIATLRL